MRGRGRPRDEAVTPKVGRVVGLEAKLKGIVLDDDGRDLRRERANAAPSKGMVAPPSPVVAEVRRRPRTWPPPGKDLCPPEKGPPAPNPFVAAPPAAASHATTPGSAEEGAQERAARYGAPAPPGKLAEAHEYHWQDDRVSACPSWALKCGLNGVLGFQLTNSFRTSNFLLGFSNEKIVGACFCGPLVCMLKLESR